MRGPLVVVACACGALATLVAPHVQGFQTSWRLSPQQPPRLVLGSRSGCCPATSIAATALGQQQQQQQQSSASVGRGRSGSIRRDATSLFGLESLLQPVARSEPSRTPQQPRQQQPQQQQNDAVAAARIKELERGVSRLAVTFGWCLSPADQQYINEAWVGLKPALTHLSDVERATVEAALEVAYHAHLGQRRKSGEPYIVHPIAVASLVADMGMDGETIAAALLHDTVEDTMLRAADVEAVFGPAVRQIVEGETKVSKLPRQLVSALEAGLSDKAAANLTHLLLAMARDWRVVVVKLADRLHNCRTLAFMAPAKQVSVSKETLAVYVPLAERLGLNSVKAELEELCFQYLHPLEHAAVTAAVASRQQLLASLHTNRFGGVRLTMDAALTEALPRLLGTRGSLKGHRVTVALEGANPFQVFQRWAARGPQGGSRLLEEGLEGERDLLTLKVVVSAAAASRGDAEAEHALCTRVLEAVEAELHAASVEGKREDLVRRPKANGYQALHAVLRVPGLPYPLQVRVQTEEMERVARHGLLALYAPRPSAGAPSSSSSSSSAAESSASAVPLQLPWLEAISARTRRAVLRDPSVTAAQLIASLQEELAVKQLEWAEAAQQAAAAGGRLKPTVGDVLEFVVRSALEEQQQQKQGVMAPGQQEQEQRQQEQCQQQQVLAGVEPRFWQSPVFLWPWCLIGNDDYTGAAACGGKAPAAAAAMQQQRRRKLQRQARGAVTAQRQGVFDSGEVQWLREAEQRHGRLALALLAYWFMQAMTDWANAASATALAAAELADILEGSSPIAAVDASVLLETQLATPLGLPALPSLSPALLAVVGAGELIGAVLPNTIEVNKRWQDARQQRLARQRRRLMWGAANRVEEEEEDEEQGQVAAAVMAETARASRSQQREAAAGFIPLVGGSTSAGSGVGGALLRLEAPWGLVRAFEGMLKAERAMGRLGMFTILIFLAVLT